MRSKNTARKTTSDKISSVYQVRQTHGLRNPKQTSAIIKLFDEGYTASEIAVLRGVDFNLVKTTIIRQLERTL